MYYDFLLNYVLAIRDDDRRNLVDVEGKVTDLHSQLISREKELAVSKAKLSEMSKQLATWEADHGQCGYEKIATKKELAALKELCDRLDYEKVKLNAEVTEYADVRREVSDFIGATRDDALLFQPFFLFTIIHSWSEKMRNCVANYCWANQATRQRLRVCNSFWSFAVKTWSSNASSLMRQTKKWPGYALALKSCKRNWPKNTQIPYAMKHWPRNTVFKYKSYGIV